MIALPKLSLSEFLNLPETKPATEFIDGKLFQKPMPQGKHSRIQTKLLAMINHLVETNKIAYAFSELRCNLGDRSFVPDIAVFSWERIPRTADGQIADQFNTYPDWCIEILSPNQSQLLVLEKLLFYLQAGTKLGWLVDPDDKVIVVVLPRQEVRVYRGNEILPTIVEIDLKLSVVEIIQWLSM